MDRPTLVLQTVYFHDSEQADARRMGQDLYGQLTRPLDDPLSFAAGIPVLSAVRSDCVDLESAETVVVIPVLGRTSFLIQRQLVLDKLESWNATLGEGHVLVVPQAPVWRNVESRIPRKQFLTELDAKDDRHKTLDEIVLAVIRLLDPNRQNVRLFVSHAKADLESSENAAKLVHDQIVSETRGHAFFETVSLEPGKPLAEQLTKAAGTGVFLAVRGDTYSSRIWCVGELLTAKWNQLPTLTVEALQKGETRSSPYAGNGPSVVWDGNAAMVASRAMIEWLISAYFRKEAVRISMAAGLPDDVVVLSRPPELLDLAQGSLSIADAKLVMHPDPELPVVERQILKAARPRLQLVTPTTAFRRLLNRERSSSSVTSPMEGLQVAMSLSDSPDVNGPEGYTAEHIKDITIFLARTLISAGASIAYGGDFRKNGFTPLLAQLIKGYNETAAKPAEFLHSYLSAINKLEDAPDDLALTVHHLAESADVRKDAILPALSHTERRPDALYHSDMRQVMAKRTFARVILGGAAEPRTEVGGPGYGGRYPGVVEEAWRTLQDGKPVYVIGGFGGAAALVADLFESDAVPERLRDETWMKEKVFAETAKSIDDDPYRKELELPERMDDLAKAVRDLAAPLLVSNDMSIRWNGLTVEENFSLLRTRDPVLIASLVLRGLLSTARTRGSGKLDIELVQGSVTRGRSLDAVAVAVFDNVPIGGAGAALDVAIGGKATLERAKGRSIVSLGSSEIDADWLYLASLGPLEKFASLEKQVEDAARKTTETAQRHGFQRLGVVAFGGTVLADVEKMADAMLRGFAELSGETTIEWFETNEDRFERLRESLAANEQISLSTRRVASVPNKTTGREEELILQVSLVDEKLSVTILPPAGSAIAASHHVTLSASEVSEFAAGSGVRKRVTPELSTLQSRGARLAEKLLGTEASKLLMQCSSFRTMIIHDVASSKLPFEMLSTLDGFTRPAVQSGISRRLAVEGVPIDRLFSKPLKVGPLEVLLIVNPSGDLPGTEEEGRIVAEILKQYKNRVKLTVLIRQEATCDNVKSALARADVLHYCGHAFFDGTGPNQSGLRLADYEPLTLADLENLNSLPRVAFVNACEAGRVRGSTTTESAAFAELFLRSGVEAYLGTFWEVGDRAAASFATGVYTLLSQGQTLESAVRKSRADLLKNGERDWANYILYGDGRFQLVVG